MSRPIVRWSLSALAAVVCAVALPGAAQAAKLKRLESIVVPGSTDNPKAVAFSTILEGGDLYRIVVTGVVDIWPANGPYTVDAVYCFNVPGFCPTTAYNNTLQWLSFEPVSDTYLGFSGFPSSTPYNPGHRYQRNIRFPDDTRLRFSLTDTEPDDNTGSFQVTLFSVPEFDFFAISCKKGDKTRYTNLTLPNRGCQSARLVALGPAGPDGAGIDIQHRVGKRWDGLPAACNEDLPPGKCQIIVRAGGGARAERYRAVLVNPPGSNNVIASLRVSIDFFA